MIKPILLLFLFSFSSLSYAICHGNNISYAPPITIDLSDKLSPANPVWTTTISTQYTGSFSCTTRNSEFGYTKILNTDDKYATILGFSGGRYNIRAEITNEITNLKLSQAGFHNASELNKSATIRFSLVPQQGQVLPGSDVQLQDILFVTDLSGMSLLDILLWPIAQLGKIIQWLFNGFRWPYDNRDMYGQPLNLRYAPKLTTCEFQNSGLVVTLPTLGRSQVVGNDRAGYTPFILNMRCENLGSNNTSDRDIDIFLSSNNLLDTDHTVLIDKTANSAKGVGLRLIKTSTDQQPIVMSTTQNNRGDATSLFYVKASGPLEPSFMIPMAVYYHPWDPQNISQGTIKTSAILNVVYP